MSIGWKEVLEDYRREAIARSDGKKHFKATLKRYREEISMIKKAGFDMTEEDDTAMIDHLLAGAIVKPLNPCSGHKYISYYKLGLKMWRVYVYLPNSTYHHVGYFDEIEDAVLARDEFLKQNGLFINSDNKIQKIKTCS